MKASEVLEKAVGLLHAGDQDGFLALLDENCVIMKDDGEEIARGAEQLKNFYTPIFAEQREMIVRIPAQFETGSIAALHEVNTNMTVNGVQKDVDTVWIYKVVNDKITYMHVFSPDDESEEAIASVA